jgi:DNA-binding transcriptional LysR family regulator
LKRFTSQLEYDMLIQPQSLKYFAEVARTGSLRQASETFFVVPSAISKQISNIEKELLKKFVNRGRRVNMVGEPTNPALLPSA